MVESELRKMIENMVNEMVEKDKISPPHITKNLNTEPIPEPKLQNTDEGKFIDDITKINLKTLMLVDNAKNREEYLEMKSKTPARLGAGKAGARYKTLSMLRMRADHAAAQDTVFTDVSEDFIKKNNLVFVQTLCKDKDEYITRPDLGRRFDSKNQDIIKSTCGSDPKVLIVAGDGLSSSAIEANIEDMIPAIKQGLSNYGISVGKILFVKHARVGASDAIGEVTNAEVVCMLIGERPGLITAESMSAYITYKPRIGIAESKRTVISNIHRGGTNPVEAGAHTAELIKKMLDKKASGIDLK